MEQTNGYHSPQFPPSRCPMTEQNPPSPEANHMRILTAVNKRGSGLRDDFQECLLNIAIHEDDRHRSPVVCNQIITCSMKSLQLLPRRRCVKSTLITRQNFKRWMENRPTTDPSGNVSHLDEPITTASFHPNREQRNTTQDTSSLASLKNAAAQNEKLALPSTASRPGDHSVLQRPLESVGCHDGQLRAASIIKADWREGRTDADDIGNGEDLRRRLSATKLRYVAQSGN